MKTIKKTTTLNVEEKKLVTTTFSVMISFPLYRFWSHRKDHIVRVKPSYYTHGKIPDINYFEVIHITNESGTGDKIWREKLYCRSGVRMQAPQELGFLLRDYATEATAKEFEAFKKSAIKAIFNHKD